MGLLGSVGALFGAGFGELLFLHSPPARVEPQQRDVCLVFDQSESMLHKTSDGRSQLDALRVAAHDFVSKPDFARDTLSLVAFSDDARILCEPTRGEAVQRALDELHAGGRTDVARALDVARTLLPAADEERWILLFTDGKPQTGRREDPVEAALRAAQACREAGVHIVCVGTGLADRALLEQLAGDPKSVFISEPEALGSAFQSSSELIQSRQMLASQPTAIDLEESLRRACGWAALVALGTGLALVRGYSRHLRRRMRVTQVLLVTIGAAASGLLAGFAGQGGFYLLSGSALFDPIVRTAAWVVLGGGLVLGMSWFVPNLPHGRALFGGTLGGAAAVACFLRIVPTLGDTPGRLLGAAILGLMAGAMTVLVEASVRRAWLVVRWPGGESSNLLLGAKPIVVGHSASAHICPSFDESRAPVIGTFTHGERGVRFDDKLSGKVRRARDGERMSFEDVVVEVHEERVEPSVRRASPEEAALPEHRESSAPRPALPRSSPSPARPRPSSEARGEPRNGRAR